MDLRRTFFTEEWQFGEGPDTRGKVVWFPALPDAKWFHDPTQYRSTDHLEHCALPGPVGPVIGGERTYVKPIPKPKFKGTGAVCGRQWFLDGIPSPPPPNPPVDDDGYPNCCGGYASGAIQASGVGKCNWISLPQAAPGVRQRAFIDGWLNNTFNLSFQTTTAPFSAVLVIVTGTASGFGPVSWTNPSGFQILMSSSDGIFSQTWYVLFDAPVMQTITITGSGYQWGWITLSMFEISNLYGRQSVDVFRIHSGTGVASIGADVTNGVLDFGLAYVATGSNPAYLSDDPNVWAPLPDIHGRSFKTGTYLGIAYLGADVYLHQASTDSAPYVGGYVLFPTFPIIGGGWVTMFGQSAAAWRSDLVFPSHWTATGTSAASFVGALSVVSVWTVTGTSADAFAGAGAVPSAWSATAASSDDLTIGINGSAAWTATASAAAAWAGQGRLSRDWTCTGASADSFVGRKRFESSWTCTGASSDSLVGAAPAFAVTLTINNTSNTNSLTLNWSGSGGTVAGQLLVVMVGARQSAGAPNQPTFTVPSGWTLLDSKNSPTFGTGNRVACYYKTAAGGSGDDGTWSTGGTSVAAYGIMVDNANQTPITVGGQQNNTNAPTCNSRTPSGLEIIFSAIEAADSQTLTLNTISGVFYAVLHPSGTSPLVQLGVSLDQMVLSPDQLTGSLTAAERWVSLSCYVVPA